MSVSKYESCILEKPNQRYPRTGLEGLIHENYCNSHTVKITKEVGDWLIAYYENRAACTPKEYLEALINDQNLDGNKFNSERIRLLYNWVNYKRIVGF